jgi:hypothetical protein
MPRLHLDIDEASHALLVALAKSQRRDVAQQAEWILITALAEWEGKRGAVRPDTAIRGSLIVPDMPVREGK